MPKKITNPRDKLFRKVFGDPAVAKDLLCAYLPEQVIKAIDFNHPMHPVNKSFVNEELQDKYSDLALELTIDGELGYVYFIVEHQSTHDKMMPIRLLEYTTSLMRDHMIEHKTEKLPIVFNVILSNRSSAYKGPHNLMDAFSDPQLAKQFMFSAYHVIDLHELTLEELKKSKKAAFAAMILKASREKDFYNWLSKNKIVWVEFSRNSTYILPAMRFVLSVSGKDSKKTLNLIKEIDPTNRDVAMTAAQELIEIGEKRGIALGEERGEKRGEKRGKEEVLSAMRMLIHGVSDSEILKKTGLTKSELLELKEGLSEKG